MWLPNRFCVMVLILFFAPGVFAATQTERIRNEKVLAVEQSVAPGESASLPAWRAGVFVYLDDGSIETSPAGGKPRAEAVKRGETVFQPPQAGGLKNVGTSPLRIVWTEYLGEGSLEIWGATGLTPNYNLLFENQYGRVYEIKIAAGISEPLHTHHDRVVVCLAGAELEHILPDGRKETSTLKTGEVVWRRGTTHVGHNLGRTDLWVIAIEPK